MMLTVTLQTNTAAFKDCPECETARILRVLAAKIEMQGLPEGAESFSLLDVNGNKVGSAY